jgi:uncharacterized protein (TIGR00730 family)
VGTTAISVFGGAEPLPGDPLYVEAYEVGALLAARGFAVITGGYGGVMEAASRGAREAGGHALGITCDIFDGRTPNRFLSEQVRTRDLYDRTRELIERAEGYVLLHGRAGTIAELAFLWALNRAGRLGRRPVILLGRFWEPILAQMIQSDVLEAYQLEVTLAASTPAEAVETLWRRLRGPATGG